MAGGLGMRPRSNLLRLISMSVGIVLGLAANADRVDAQPGRTMAIDDQPGMCPIRVEERLPAAYQRQAVFYRTNEPPGTIIVDTADRYLYLVQGNNRAIRYGIGVGREGFQWQGLLKVTRKAEWPDWTPPPEMIARQPYLPRFMAGGPGQSDGRARALSRRHHLSHPRHQSAANHRQRRLVRLLPAGERRRR